MQDAFLRFLTADETAYNLELAINTFCPIIHNFQAKSVREKRSCKKSWIFTAPFKVWLIGQNVLIKTALQLDKVLTYR